MAFDYDPKQGNYVTFGFYQEPKPEEVTYCFDLSNVDHFGVHDGFLEVVTRSPLFPTTSDTENAFISKDEVAVNYFSKEDLFVRLLKRAEILKEEAEKWGNDKLFIMAGHYQHESGFLERVVRDLRNGTV